MEAKPLRHGNLPFQVVADDPGLGHRGSEHGEGVMVRLLLGLAEAHPALDLPVHEMAGEVEAVDLCALTLGPAVRDQREATAPTTPAAPRFTGGREQTNGKPTWSEKRAYV